MLLKQHQSGQPVDRLESVTHMDQISAIQQEIKEVFIGDPVMDYLLDVVRTRARTRLFYWVRAQGQPFPL